MAMTDKTNGHKDQLLRSEYLRKQQLVDQVRAAEALVKQKLSNEKSTELQSRMTSVLIQFAERLANKQSLEFPNSPNTISREDRWKYIKELMTVMELELSINAVFLDPEDDEINLDEKWKSISSTYIAHIRAVVSKVNIPEALRERILLHLNKLQLEIDRNRTKLSSLTEVFLSLTEAVGKGAKNLTPAVRIFEKLAGAFSGARTSHLEYEPQARLPPPESLGLTDLPPDETEASDPPT